MNILYCGDKNIADGVIISVLSLLKNTKEQINVYILTASVKTQDRSFESLHDRFARFLDAQLKEVNPGNSAEIYDVTGLFHENIPYANIETRFTPCCMLRLFADLVPQIPDKMLYLDNDVVCRLDPAEFYNQDTDGFEVIGVLDHYGSWFFRNNPFKRDYLNSGVLMLNLRLIRTTGLFEKCRRLCSTKQMFMPDQSAINKLSRFKKICPRRYNEQRKLHKDTVFQHFTTSFRFFPFIRTVSVKPWDIEGMHNILHISEYDELLNDFLRLKEKYNEYSKRDTNIFCDR